MSAEVRIVVRQESQGTAIRDAERDLERLQKKPTTTSGAKHNIAAERESVRRVAAELERAQASGGNSGADERKARQREAAQARLNAIYMKQEAAQALKEGDKGGASFMEREAQIMARSATIQRQMNVDRRTALELSKQEVQYEEIKTREKQKQRATDKTASNPAGEAGMGGGLMSGMRGLRASIGTFAIGAVAGILEGAIERITSAQTRSHQTRMGARIDERKWERNTSVATTSKELSGVVESGIDDLAGCEEKEAQIKADIARSEREKIIKLATWTGGAAAAGSFIAPGVGTVIGAGVGAGAAALYNKYAIDPEIAANQSTLGSVQGSKKNRARSVMEKQEELRLQVQQDLEVQRAQASGDNSKVREAEERQAWTKTYRERKNLSASPEAAREFADLEFTQRRKAAFESGPMGKIDAHSGNSEIQRALDLAQRNNDQVLRELQGIHRDILPKGDFSRPSRF